MKGQFDKYIAINATNLHGGGGVTVATSVILGLSRKKIASIVDLFISTKVSQNLLALGFQSENFRSVTVLDSVGIKTLVGPLASLMRNHDVILNIFGPIYLPRIRGVVLTGFALPWIIYPKNSVRASLGIRKRFISDVFYFLKKIFFCTADILIVELDHVKSRLQRDAILGNKQVVIINNCVDPVFQSPSQWESICADFEDTELNIGFPSKFYPHKNILAMARVVELLREKYDLPVRFWVTLSPDDWRCIPKQDQKYFGNAGELRLSQCPTFYKKLDAVVFPSLLECFSATPIEALSMGCTVLASDLPFIRDVCGDQCIYFDPLSPSDMALKISEYLCDPKKYMKIKRKVHENWFSSDYRADKYEELLWCTLNQIES